MRDRSKQLLVINTGKKESEQTRLPAQSGTTHIIGGGGLSVNMSDYLLKSIWDKVFEIRTDGQGKEYIFGKLPMVTQYGITMYSGDGVDIPSLASGLPFDGRTIWYNPDTQQIEVIGGTGGGSGEGVSNFWDLSGIPSWITISKPKYTYSEIEGTPDLSVYAKNSDVTALSGKLNDFLEGSDTDTIINKWKELEVFLNGLSESDSLATILSSKVGKDYVDGNFVTLGTTQSILGEKDFVGGLKVNGSPIYYDTEKKYWKLEGDLLVTGGVTMYGSDSSFTPSTIMDAIAVDGTTISKSGGVLKVIGGTGGGVADSVAWGNITGKPTWIGSSKPSYSYSEITGAISTTELQNYLTSNSYLNVTSGDNRYLKLGGGTINGKLTIKNSTREVLDIISTDIYGPLVKLCYYNDVALSSFGHIRKATESNLGAYWMNNESGCGIMLGSDGKAYIFTNQAVKAEHEIWHKGNFTPSNYLPLNGNASSSTKLQTARTIWGQSFDGTRNVSGALSDVTGITFKNDYYGLVIDEFGNFSFKKPSSTAAVDWSFKDSSGNKLMIINNSGNVGIGTASPSEKLDVIGKVKADALYLTRNNGTVAFTISEEKGTNGYNIIAGGGTSYIRFYTNYTSGAEERMRIDSYGNLGIGTTLPSYKLHVVGNAYVRDGISMARSRDNSNAFFIGKEDSSSQNLQIVNSSGSGKIILRTNKNSSIVDHFVLQQGSTALYDNLTINGYVKANYYDVSTTRQASLSNSYTLGCGMYGSSIQHSVSDGYTLPALMWSAKSPNGNSSQFSIMSYHPSGATGYLIIGVAKNGTRTAFIEVQGDGVIQAGGDFLASGGITMYSDQRKKTILSHVELSLKDIANAPLIEHYYNSDDKRTTHVGSIAQYWASMNDWFCKLDSEGYYTMEIQNAALASAISIARELDRYESKTDKTIKQLKKRICQLEEEVERLRAS